MEKTANNHHEPVVTLSEAFRYGWKTTLKHFWFFFGLFLIMWLTNVAPSAILRGNDSFPRMLLLLLAILLWIINLEMRVAMIKIFLAFEEKRKPTFSELFAWFQLRLLVRFFVAAFLYSALVAIGLVLLVIPGVYFAVKYCFVPYLVVDKNTDIFEAFHKSAKLTSGVRKELLLFALLSFLIVILGAAAFGIGLFVAIPTVFLASIYIYRRLDHHERH